jgi:hypothetical protein
MIKQIIINADDFGLKTSVNKAIVTSFNSGLINSTTLMANMEGFDEAVELAHQNGIISKIGIHLVLSDGLPLTREILGANLFYNGSVLHLRKYKRRLFFLSRNNKIKIYNEFAAQIDKVRKAGIPVTHIDTHHHIDDVWSVTHILIALLKTYGIRSMRILNNLNKSTKFYKTGYRRIVNEFIKYNHANFSDFFGDQYESVSFLRNTGSLPENSTLEIMVHPDYNDNGILINRFHNKEVVFDYPEDIKPILNLRTSR